MYNYNFQKISAELDENFLISFQKKSNLPEEVILKNYQITKKILKHASQELKKRGRAIFIMLLDHYKKYQTYPLGDTIFLLSDAFETYFRKKIIDPITKWKKLEDFILEMEEIQTPAQIIQKDVKFIASEENYTILNIKKTPTCPIYFQGTKWCVANRSMATQYLKGSISEAPGFYLILKDADNQILRSNKWSSPEVIKEIKNHRYALDHFSLDQNTQLDLNEIYQGSDDLSLNDLNLGQLNTLLPEYFLEIKNPQDTEFYGKQRFDMEKLLAKYVLHKEIEIKKPLKNQILEPNLLNYINAYQEGIFSKEQLKELSSVKFDLTKETPEILLLLGLELKERIPEFEEYFKRNLGFRSIDINYLYIYTKDIIKGKFSLFEDCILTEIIQGDYYPTYAFVKWYITNILKKPDYPFLYKVFTTEGWRSSFNEEKIWGLIEHYFSSYFPSDIQNKEELLKWIETKMPNKISSFLYQISNKIAAWTDEGWDPNKLPKLPPSRKERYKNLEKNLEKASEWKENLRIKYNEFKKDLNSFIAENINSYIFFMLKDELNLNENQAAIENYFLNNLEELDQVISIYNKAQLKIRAFYDQVKADAAQYNFKSFITQTIPDLQITSLTISSILSLLNRIKKEKI